jgi:flagellar biosynthesis/type III secretory pathway chaperone
MNVDPQIAQQIADLGIRLGDAVLRNTAGAIADRIQTAKAKRTDKETINELEEIINSLIADKNELVQIAQAYEQEFVAQQVSPEDIEYITKKFIPVLKDLIKQTSSDQNVAAATNIEKAIDSFTPLLSVEMLTVLQLVGFNFKKAIGEPLTLLLQKFITSKVPSDPQSNLEYNKLLMTFNIELVKVAQDKEANDRWERLKSN